jgi:hypothetical protein
MADAFNPYAPPAADLDVHAQVGAVARDGDLVRMDRNGQLPERCVTCNAPAVPARVSLKLYWTPLRWRFGAWTVSLLLFALMVLGFAYAAIAFWPTVLILAVINMVIRKRVTLDLGICERHRRRRALLRGSAVVFVLLVIMLAISAIFIGENIAGPWIFLLIPLMLLLGLANSLSPVNSVRIAKLDERHLWLKRTGKAFRDSLSGVTP